MSASSAWPVLGSEPRYASEPRPQAEEESESTRRMVNKVLSLASSRESPGLLCLRRDKGSNLSAAFEEQAFESRTGPHQRLDAILGDLITPGDVELLQQGTTLTDGMRAEKKINK